MMIILIKIILGFLKDWQIVKVEEKNKTFSKKDYFLYNYLLKEQRVLLGGWL